MFTTVACLWKIGNTLQDANYLYYLNPSVCWTVLNEVEMHVDRLLGADILFSKRM